MITPVVFPFTFVDAKTAKLLLSCFERIRVYIPTDSAGEAFDPDVLDNGRIELRNPIPDSGHGVDRAFDEYRQWRRANMGTDISFLKSSVDQIPFFNESTISYLRQDILDADAGASDEPADMLLAARVFLRMTENYDRVQTEIEESLFSQDAKKLSMLAALRGEEDNSTREQSTSTRNALDEAGELMTTERLTAWSMLAAEDDRLSPVYVTPGRTVAKTVLDRFEDVAVTWKDIPVPGEPDLGDQWQNDLAAFLENLADSKTASEDKTRPPAIPTTAAGALLTIIHLPGVSPRLFLDKISSKQLKTKEEKENNRSTSTIVAAVHPT